jgi:hypothetical protein
MDLSAALPVLFWLVVGCVCGYLVGVNVGKRKVRKQLVNALRTTGIQRPHPKFRPGRVDPRDVTPVPPSKPYDAPTTEFRGLGIEERPW